MTPEEPIVVVYTTAPDVASAKAIAEQLINTRVAACVNILPSMISVYRWQGKVNHDDEAVLIIKTRQSLSRSVVREVSASHPYDVPSIMVVPVTSGTTEFANWITLETKPPDSDES